MPADQSLSFDRYRVDLVNEQIWQGPQLIALTSKAFAVLRYLVEHAGQLVTKAELFDTLWPDTVVSDGALTFCIVELRKALSDDAKAPRFIETVHRRGYRFIAKVVSSQYSVVSSLPPPPQSSALRPQSCVLVGREADLTQLHRWLEKAVSGERQIVFVTGEPGIGKTTLVEAFRQRLETGGWGLAPAPQASSLKPLASPVSFARGQCIEQYGPGEPYMPILEALGRLCRGPEGKLLISLLHRHAPTWLVQMPTLLNAAELEALQRKTQGATRERMLREMGEAVEVLTAECPLVLVLEDLHWSDASTLEFLALLARRREPARLLVIGIYRPVDVIVQEHPLRTVKQELQLHGLCAELPLGLLSETQVAEYLERRTEIETATETERTPDRPLANACSSQAGTGVPQLARILHRRTDGNPLFMITAVNDLLSQGVLVSGDGQWAVPDGLASIETRVPASLQQLIERQIERLKNEDRQMLEVASVAGIEFSAAAVAAGVETETEGVEEWCEGLVRRGQFLRAQGPADWPDGTVAARYSFLHALYQEVLYERIPAGRRQRLHQQIGEREEQAYGERAREIAAALAMHFEQGRDYRKAMQYLRRAGRNAMRRSAHQEAITHFTKGLELLKLLPDTPKRAQQELLLLLLRAPALISVKGYAAAEVEHTYARAYDLCQRGGKPHELLYVLPGLQTFYRVRGEAHKAREVAEQAWQLAQRVATPTALMAGHALLVEPLLDLGEFTAAHEHLEQAWMLYNPHEHNIHVFPTWADLGVVLLSHSASILWLLGYPGQAQQRCQKCLTLAEGLSHPFSLAFALSTTSWFHSVRQEWEQARKRAEEMITLATEQGFPFWLAQGTAKRGQALAEQGQVEEGIAQMQEGLAAYQITGHEAPRAADLPWQATAYAHVGQVEEGLAVLAEALAFVDKTGVRFYEAELYRLRGELMLTQSSVQRLESGIQENQKSKVKRQKARVTDPRSLTPDPQGEAETCFLKAIDIARKQSAKSLELRATMSLTRLWQQQSKHHEAHKMLSYIYNWFTEGFDTKDLQEAKALLEELGH